MAYLPKKFTKKLKALGVYQLVGGSIGFVTILIALFSSEVLLRPSLVTIAIGLILFTFSMICGSQILFLHSRKLRLSLINQWLQVFGIWAGPWAFKYAGAFNVSLRLLFDENKTSLSADLSSITFAYLGDYMGISVDISALVIIITYSRLSDEIKEYEFLRDYRSDDPQG